MSSLSAFPEAVPDLRYPIGPPPRPGTITRELVISAVAELAELPSQLRNAVDELDCDQCDTPYRDGGWTVRQLVHHIADSHMNAFCRVRLALTEDQPVIAVYNEKAWAELPDSAAPIEWSLELIESLHARWVMLLQSLTPEQWKCGFIHPERGPMTVEAVTLLYAWHSRHHVAHIARLRAREDW